MTSFTQNSCTPSHLLAIELEQSYDEGKDITSFKEEVQFIRSIADTSRIDRDKHATELFIKLQNLTSADNYPYTEPNAWDDIINAISASNFVAATINENQQVQFNRILGGILGKCIGCLLGKPVEGWKQNQIVSFLTETNNFPIHKYLFDSLNTEQCKKYGLSDFWSAPITAMPEDDDINYLLIAAKILKEFGTYFTSNQVAEIWTNFLPLCRLCTAERIAYRNFVNGIYPPESAFFCNPYREWIGALIRADVWGYISPGNPKLAMKLAWKDACISHVKNGIYGAMWVAVILSLVPTQKSVARIVTKSLDFIPKKSRFYNAISSVIYWYENKMSASEAITNIHANYSEQNIHHWCHVLSNAMIITVALLWGENDFQHSIHLALTAGFDTDSNGATVGSIVGYSIGANNIPSYWKDTLQNRIYSSISGENLTKIDNLANSILEFIRAPEIHILP